MDGRRVDKAGSAVEPGAVIEVSPGGTDYVGRGGDKLAGALDVFPVKVEGKTALDVGASTGGFTDCLLRRGAAKVYALDVGYGQLAWRLQKDPRVVRLDRVNIRKAGRDLIPEVCDLAVIDTSFISLRLVVPHVLPFLGDEGEIVALVKPQFEVGRGRVGKGGVVKDPGQHRDVLLELTAHFSEAGLAVRGWAESPLRGAGGNREFFLHLGRGGRGDERERVEEEIRNWIPAEA